MFKTIIPGILILLCLFCSACGQQEATFYELSFEQDRILLQVDNQPFTGIYAEYYDYDLQNPKSLITVRNGVMHGKFQHYYPNGNLREEGTYKDGSYYGYHSIFWENGNIKQKYYTSRDTAGYNYEYFDSGRLKEMRHYNAQGRLDGKSFTFYENGKVKEEMNYSEGKKNGLFITRDRDGFLVTLYEYKDDILQERNRQISHSDLDKISALHTQFYNFM